MGEAAGLREKGGRGGGGGGGGTVPDHKPMSQAGPFASALRAESAAQSQSRCTELFHLVPPRPLGGQENGIVSICCKSESSISSAHSQVFSLGDW